MRRAVLLGSLLATAAGAPDAAATVVLVEPDGPDPERARVAPLFSVRWENLTSTAQRVESIGRPRFAGVSVPANGAAERRFDRPGRYRYRLSATGQEGVVIVGAATRRARPRSRGHGCSRREVFLYDVTVRGRKSGGEEWLPRYDLTGRFTFGYRYTARYPRLAVTVSHDCFGGVRIRGKQAGAGAVPSYAWSDQVVSTHPESGTTVPCDFTERASDLAGRIEVEGELDRRGAWALSVESRLDQGQSEALGELLGAARDGVCDKGDLTNARVFDSLPGHGTVPIFESQYRVGPFRMQSPHLGLPGSFGWSGARRPPVAVRALARGRGFSLESGRKHYSGTSSQTVAEADANLKITFSRR